MASIRFAVCDDDELICEAVVGKIGKFFSENGYKSEYEKYTSALSLYKRIKAGAKFDIIFLDIDMPALNGIELAKNIREIDGKEPKIVFISNREDRVFETFQVQPYGFFRKNNFTRDMTDALKEYLHEIATDNYSIAVQTNNNSVVRTLKVAEIVYIESYKSSQTVYLADGTTVSIHMTMEELENKLEEYDILRIYKGYLVNLSYVRKIEKNGVYVEFSGNERCLNISRNKVQDIKDKYLSYLRRTGSIMSQ